MRSTPIIRLLQSFSLHPPPIPPWPQFAPHPLHWFRRQPRCQKFMKIDLSINQLRQAVDPRNFGSVEMFTLCWDTLRQGGSTPLQ